MSQHVDLTEYYTRRQCQALFSGLPTIPAPPTNLAVFDKGLGVVQSYLDISLVPPILSGSATVAGYDFEVIWQQGGHTQTQSFSLLVNLDNVYGLEPLPDGVAVAISARTRDNLGAISVASAILNAICATDGVPPAAPIIAGVAVDTGVIITLSSDINSESDFAYYALRRGRGADVDHIIWESVPVLSFISAMVEDSSLPETADDYWYKVQALDFSGNGSYSNIVGPFSSIASGMSAPPPVDLTGSQALAQSNGSILIEWVPSSYINLKEYRLWRRIAGSSNWELIVTLAAIPGVPLPYVTYTDSSTELGVTYDYTLTQVNTNGDESAFPLSFLQATASDSMTEPVSNLALTGTLGGLDVVWTRSPSRNVVYYEVSWQLTPLAAIEGMEGVLTNFAQIRGLTTPRDQLANQLTVTVVAVGVYSRSVAVSKTATYNDLIGYQPADGSIPMAPASVSYVKNDDGSVTLSWPASQSSDRSGYQVERWDTLTSAWQIVGQLQNDLPGTISFIATGLEPYSFRHTLYRFRIRTLDYSGNISRVNMLENPGFEDAVLAPWTAPLGVAVVGTSYPMAPSARALRANAAAAPAQSAAIIAGEHYCFSAYVRENPFTPGGTAQVAISWLDSGGAPCSAAPTYSSIITSNGNYQRLVVVNAIAPLDAGYAKVRLLPGSVEVYWDCCQLEQGAQETSYNDARTGLISVIDNVAPQDYDTLALEATSGLGQINLRWVNPSPLFSGAYDYINSVFEVWRKVTASAQPDLAVDADFRKIAEVPGQPDSGTNGFDDLDPDEDYHVTAQYKLRARDRYGNQSGYLFGGNNVAATSLNLDDVAAGHGDGLYPVAPVLVSALANSDGTVKLTWDEADTAGRNDLAGYNIWRKKQGESAFGRLSAVLARNGSGILVGGIYQYSFTDNAVSPDFTWVYTVSAFDSQLEEGGFDATGLSVLPVDTRPPAIPANLVIAGDIGRIAANWSPASHAVSYLVSFTDPDNAWAYVTQIPVQSTHYDAVLINGASAESLIANFVLRVWSVNRSGYLSNGYASATLTSDSMHGYVPVDNAAPSAPGIPVVQYNFNGEVILSWAPSSSTDVSLYLMDSSYAGGSWYAAGMAAAPTTGVRLTGLQSYRDTGQTYRFRVTAIDHFNNSTQGPVGEPVQVQADTVPPGKPATPAGFTDIDPGGSTSFVSLSWLPNSEGDLNHYELWYQNNTTGLGGPVMVAAGAPQWTFTGLYPGTSFSFWVVAVDNATNRSIPSDTLTITTAASHITTGAPPPAPFLSITPLEAGYNESDFTIAGNLWLDGTMLAAYTAPDFAHFNVYAAGGTNYVGGVLTPYTLVGNPSGTSFGLNLAGVPTTDLRLDDNSGYNGCVSIDGYTRHWYWHIYVQAVDIDGHISSTSNVIQVHFYKFYFYSPYYPTWCVDNGY